VQTSTAGAAPNWRRTLTLMVIMQATMATSFSISQPFMPFFLEQLGLRPMSAVSLWAGYIGGVQAFTIALVSPFWGSVADRYGRKLMVMGSCCAVVFVYLLIPMCREPWQVLGAYALAGMFGGFSSAAMTLVSTQVPEGRLGFALGWMQTGQLVGYLSGPLIGGLLSDRVHDYRVVFVITACGALLGTVLVTVFVRESFQRPPPASGPRAGLRAQIGELIRHPALVPITIVLLLAQIMTYGPSPVIPLYIKQMVGDAPWLSTAAGAAVAISGIAGLLSAPWLGRLGDRGGYRTILIVSLAGSAVCLFPQAFASNYWLFLTERFVLGLFVGAAFPAGNALLGRAFPREQRGRIYGIASLASYMGLAIGPIVTGTVGARFGFPSMFLVVGALTLVGLAIVLFTPGIRDADKAT
jgi:DHA1 family multidrug resistance protein-like MFS transporter